MIRALFGGSFDPFHRGHRAIIGELLERGLADVVHVVPAGRSPFKDGSGASAEHRLAMTRAALADLDGVVIEDLEIERGGPSYTIDTLRTLVERHPEALWRLAVGADSVAGLPGWRDIGSIVAVARLVVFPREGGPVATGLDGAPPLVVDEFRDDVSSTAVREALDAGDLPEHLLPDVVAEYIRRHRLYGFGASGG